VQIQSKYAYTDEQSLQRGDAAILSRACRHASRHDAARGAEMCRISAGRRCSVKPRRSHDADHARTPPMPLSAISMRVFAAGGVLIRAVFR